MGAADIVPGVSGGTIAFITGIYDELVQSIASINLRHVKAGLSIAWPMRTQSQRRADLSTLSQVNWVFFLPLVLGIFSAALSLSRLIHLLLEQYLVLTYSFFFGLILVSIWFPFQGVEKRWRDILALIVVATGSFFLFDPDLKLAGSQTPLALFGSGALAICALVLPGISGSYILVLLGQYKIVLAAISQRELPTIFYFGLGMLVGLFSFIRVLKFILKHYRSTTMACLTGLMIGSLRVIWPFHYQSSTSNTPVAAIATLMLLGVAVILGLESLSRFQRQSKLESKV